MSPENLRIFFTLMNFPAPPSFGRTILFRRTSQNYLQSLMREFSVPAWEMLSEFSFISSNESSCLSHITSYTICSIFHWPVFPPLQFHWHKICHLVKKLEGYGPIWGAGANPFVRRDSLLWGIFSKSADLAAWAWCDWCRHLSPGVTVIAISVTVSAGFPLHYLKELWMSETVGL